MPGPVNLPDGWEYDPTPASDELFSYTGGYQSWAVPEPRAGWLLVVNVEGRGGTSGACSAASTGYTRQAVVEISEGSPLDVLIPGDPRYGTTRGVQVGGAGGLGTGTPGGGGWPNGGPGGACAGGNECGGGGGGSSVVDGFGPHIPGCGGQSGNPNLGTVIPEIPIQPEPPGGPGLEPAVVNARSVFGGNLYDPALPNDRGTPAPFSFNQGGDGSDGEGGVCSTPVAGRPYGAWSPPQGAPGSAWTGLGTGEGGAGADGQDYTFDLGGPDETYLGAIGGGGGGGGFGGGAGGGGSGDEDHGGQGPYEADAEPLPTDFPTTRFGGSPWPTYATAECYADTLRDPGDPWDQWYANSWWALPWGGGGDGGGTFDRIAIGDDVTGDGHLRITAWWIRYAPASGWKVGTV